MKQVSSRTYVFTVTTFQAITLAAAFQTNYLHCHGTIRRRRLNQRNDYTLQQRRKISFLKDISEWRDLIFDDFHKPAAVAEVVEKEKLEGPAKEVCILPFPIEDVLVQGETKEICLYEERFHRLFEKSLNQHGGILAMGLLAPPSGILQVMPLCEIESYSRMPGETGFGTSYSILATIRVVGRASLVYVTEEHKDNLDYLKGWCTELFDDMPGSNSMKISEREDSARSLKLANDMVERMENVMESVIKLEDQIDLIQRYSDGVTVERDLDKLVYEGEDDDDDEEEDEDDNRQNRFKDALQAIKLTDMQGYTISTSTSALKSLRSIQDLTALSWAYVCTESQPVDILVYRLRALECVDVCQRLKVALMALMERKSKLKLKMRAMVSDEEEEE